MMEQFARGERWPNDPLPEARALLDRLEISSIEYNCWPWYKLQLYDDQLRRRVRWAAEPQEDGRADRAIVTRSVHKDPERAQRRDREYLVLPLTHDLAVEGVVPLLLVPRMVTHSNPHAVIRQAEYAMPFEVTGVRISRLVGNHWGERYWETPKLGAWLGMGQGGRVEVAFSALAPLRVRAVIPIAAWVHGMTPERFPGLCIQARRVDGGLMAMTRLAASATQVELMLDLPSGNSVVDLSCAADAGPVGDQSAIVAIAGCQLWPVTL